MSAYSDKVILDGARFYWRLGEAAGTTAVDQKGILNGTYIGTPTLAMAGALQGSGDTDTSVGFLTDGKYVSIAADSRHQNLSNFTIEAWLYPTAAMGGSVDIGIVTHQWSSSNVALSLTFGTLSGADPTGRRVAGGFNMTSGGWRRVSDPVNLTLNTWYHYAVTYDGTTLVLYRNGVQVASAAASGLAPPPADKLLYISKNDANAWAVKGRVDEVAIYPTALSATQILDHYNLGTSPPAVVPNVFLDASIIGNEARANEYLSGGFLCGVDPLRVTAALGVSQPNYISFAAAVQGAGAISSQSGSTLSLSGSVAGVGNLGAQVAPLRGFAATVSGASALTQAITVLLLVKLDASVQGGATVTPQTLGKSISLSSHVGGPLCGEHLCGEFLCDNVGAYVNAGLSLNKSLAVAVEGESNLLVTLGRTLQVSVQIGGQAKVTVKGLDYGWLIPTTPANVILPPTVEVPWILVPTVEEDWLLVPTTERG